MEKVKLKKNNLQQFLKFFLLLPFMFVYFLGHTQINLPVDFLPQVPPGTWSQTRNCGETAAAMIFAYYNNQTPTEQDIRDIDDWFASHYSSFNIRDYNGDYTNTAMLSNLSINYGNFTETSYNSGGNMNTIYNELNNGYPVIVAVRLNMSSSSSVGGHFMVVRGYDNNYVYVNDPGRSLESGQAENKAYSHATFLASWATQGYAYVTIHNQNNNNTPPTVSNLNAYQSGNEIVGSFSIYDDESNSVKNVRVFISEPNGSNQHYLNTNQGGYSDVISEGQFTFSISASNMNSWFGSSGTYKIKIEAWDQYVTDHETQGYLQADVEYVEIYYNTGGSNDCNAPTVNLSSPSNNSSFTEGETINFSWSANGNGCSVVNYEFWIRSPNGVQNTLETSNTESSVDAPSLEGVWFWGIKAENNEGVWSERETRAFVVGSGGNPPDDDYCTSNSQYPSGTMTPNNEWQTRSGIYAGEYSVFYVEEGETYIFSLCESDGGNADYDSQMVLRKNSDGSFLEYSDDDCSGADAKITWTATFTGEVRTLINEFNCQTNSTNTTIAYKKDGGSTPDNNDIFIENASVEESSVLAGEQINVSCEQHYVGNNPDVDPRVGYYLSTNNSYGSSDAYLGDDVSSLGDYDSYDPENETLTIPSNTSPGNYYILFYADYENSYSEDNENNNVASVPITIEGESNSCDDPLENNENYIEAYNIGNSSSYSNSNLCLTPGDEDWFKFIYDGNYYYFKVIGFSASVEGNYAINFSRSGSDIQIETMPVSGSDNIDTKLYLYDTDHTTQLVYDDDGGSSVFSLINHSFSEPPYLTVSSTSETVTATTGVVSGSINITSNIQWTAQSNQTWLTFTSNSTVTGNGILDYKCSDNTSTSSRTATITVSGSGVSSQTISVTQAGANSYLTVNPTSLNFNAISGSANASVSTNVSNWNVTDNVNWITVTKSGNNINITYQVNTSTSSRNAIITVSASGVSSQTISVTQAGANSYLTVNPTSLNFNASSGSASASVSTNVSNWSVTDNVNWITVTKSGNNINITYQANTSTSERQATISINAPGVSSQTISVTQAGANSYLTVNPTSLNFNASSGSASASVSTNVSNWSVTDNVNWITVTKSGNNINITYQANTSTSERPATISINAPGVSSQTISVIQTGANSYLTVNPTSLNFSASSGTASAIVNTNISNWSVTDDANWITVTKSGNNINITYQANTSTNPRTATIDVSGSGITETISVTQTGAVITDFVNISVSNIEASPSEIDVPILIELDNYYELYETVGAIQMTLNYDATSGVHLTGDYELTNRTQGFTATINVNENGVNSSATVLLYSMSGASISPNTGEILKIFFNVDGNAVENSNTCINLNNVLVSDVVSNSLPVNHTEEFCIFIAEQFAIGDINEDGNINIFDLQILINVILNNDNNSGHIANSDLNDDGNVNIFDLQALINLILGNNSKSLFSSDGLNTITLPSLELTTNSVGEFFVKLNNESSISAFEFDIIYDASIGFDILSVGLVESLDDFEISYQESNTENGLTKIKVVVYSMSMNNLPINIGELIKIVYETDEMANGFSDLDFTSVIFTNQNLENLEKEAVNGNVTINGINNLEKTNLEKISIYPNPAKDKLFVSGNVENANLKIFNLQSQLVLEKVLTDDKAIDISKLEIGLYTVKIQTKNNIFINKLIKK